MNKFKSLKTRLLVGANEDVPEYVSFYINPLKISGFYVPEDNDGINNKHDYINIILDGQFFSVAQDEDITKALEEMFNLDY